MLLVDGFVHQRSTTKLPPLRKMQNKGLVMNTEPLLSSTSVVSLLSKFMQISNSFIHASPKIKLVMAIHVAVIAAVVVFWKTIRTVITKFVEKTNARVNGGSQKPKTLKDVASDDGSMEDRRVALEVAYARRKREEQEQARQSSLMKGMDREATELRRNQLKTPSISEILRKTSTSPINLAVEVPKQVVLAENNVAMNAAKQRELAAIEQRMRQQEKMMANTPMAPSQSTDDLRADQARRLLQAVLSVEASTDDDEDVAVALELQRQKLANEGEKYRKLTSMMATAERDAKRSTESALANIKAKVADVVEQRLESEEKEEEARYAQEWAAAVSSTTKEPVRSSIYSVLSAVVGRSQRWFGREEPTEEEALAIYSNKLKAQKQSAAQNNARSKGHALENAEQVAMKSQMLREEAETKARMEEEEDRQALATALRRKEAEEAAAAVSYAKTVKRVEDAKRARAINKLKALEQAGEYVRQPAPSTDAGVPVIAAATIATATGTIVESTYRNTPTTAEQEALAMYAKKINPTKIANSATTEAEALALYQKSLKAQQYAAAVINARNKGQALENAELVAMKSQMLREEAEAKARMEEEEDRQARATAVRRKEAEEAAAAVSYAKSVQRVEDAKRARAINKLKALEQAGEYVRQLAPSIASQFVLSTSTVDLKEQQARRLLNAIISVEARDTVPEAAARNRISIRLEKTTDMTQANEDVDQRKSTVQSNALATVVVEREASETGKASPLTASRTVMDFVVSALRAVRTLVWVDHRSE